MSQKTKTKHKNSFQVGGVTAVRVQASELIMKVRLASVGKCERHKNIKLNYSNKQGLCHDPKVTVKSEYHSERTSRMSLTIGQIFKRLKNENKQGLESTEETHTQRQNV